MNAIAEPLAAQPQPLAREPRVEPRPVLLSSAQLLRGQRLVEIAHNGEIYRLHATRQGKLILTK